MIKSRMQKMNKIVEDYYILGADARVLGAHGKENSCMMEINHYTTIHNIVPTTSGHKEKRAVPTLFIGKVLT